MSWGSFFAGSLSREGEISQANKEASYAYDRASIAHENAAYWQQKWREADTKFGYTSQSYAVAIMMLKQELRKFDPENPLAAPYKSTYDTPLQSVVNDIQAEVKRLSALEAFLSGNAGNTPKQVSDIRATEDARACKSICVNAQ